jgi:hypothetical protein
MEAVIRNFRGIGCVTFVFFPCAGAAVPSSITASLPAATLRYIARTGTRTPL